MTGEPQENKLALLASLRQQLAEAEGHLTSPQFKFQVTRKTLAARVNYLRREISNLTGELGPQNSIPPLGGRISILPGVVR